MLQAIKKHTKAINREIKRLGKNGWTIDDVKYLLDDSKTTRANYYFDLVITGLILLSCLLYVVLTYLEPGTIEYLFVLSAEIVLMVFFTIEYILRIQFEKKPTDYLVSGYGIFDFLAVVPFWLSFLIPGFGGMQFLRVLRVFKLYRFFAKYLDNDNIKKEIASRILITKMIFTLGVLLFISAGMIYTFETPVNQNINTFDDALYFSLVTVTTVGFGDITPESGVGRVVVMIMVLASILVIPVYVASLLRSYMSHSGKRATTCPKCGLKYHDENAVHCKMCGEIIYQEYDDQ